MQRVHYDSIPRHICVSHPKFMSTLRPGKAGYVPAEERDSSPQQKQREEDKLQYEVYQGADVIFKGSAKQIMAKYGIPEGTFYNNVFKSSTNRTLKAKIRKAEDQ